MYPPTRSGFAVLTERGSLERSSKRAFQVGLLAAVAITGCGGDVGAPLPQWLVVVSTDALLPQLGDRLSIEILTEDGSLACPSCRRQFPAEDPTRWPISFGIAPSHDGKPLRVHAQLFRSISIGPDGSPAGNAKIDRLITLPAPEPELHIALPLPMKCFGVAASVAARQDCDPMTGMLVAEAVAGKSTDTATLKVGSWPPGQPVPCLPEAPPEMVCIPGGAFLLGDPRAPSFQGPSYATTPEHLVQISRFLLDERELTVEDLRTLRLAHPEIPKPSLASPISECTFADTGNEAMPVNCLSRDLAETICTAQGKRLPTEAEWEYAAGNRSAETPFPWGVDDAHICNRAVVGRGGITSSQVSLCQITDAGTLDPGPALEGSADDTTVLGLVDLGGNLSEWTADAFSPYDQGYWAAAPPLIKDPRCNASPPEFIDQATVRGANWQSRLLESRATTRYAALTSATDPIYGVRCARSF